jgi:hypothetical protein
MIAIITMLIDHSAAIFVPNNLPMYWVLRGIGRLAFPIFAFLLVEGFFHTRDVKKYLIRLGLFAFISEIPFDLAFYKTFFYPGHQNIFFTLFLGLLLMMILKKAEERFKKKTIISNILDAVITVGFCIIAVLLATDYNYSGILLIISFYLFRGNKILLTLSLLIVTGYLMGPFSAIATLSMIFIWFYNGKKGRDAKYLFYIFYPAHLLILFFISKFVL